MSSCDEAFAPLTELPELQEARRFVGLPVRLPCLGAAAPNLYLLAPFLEAPAGQKAPGRRGRRGRRLHRPGRFEVAQEATAGLLGEARRLCGCVAAALLDERAPKVLAVLEGAPLVGSAENVVAELAAGLPRLTSCEAACAALEVLLRRRKEWPEQTGRALWKALQRCLPDFDADLGARLRAASSSEGSVAGSRTSS